MRKWILKTTIDGVSNNNENYVNGGNDIHNKSKRSRYRM